MSDYIDHDGKGMPVDGDTLVFVRFGDGHGDEFSFFGGERKPTKAKYWHNHIDEPSDSDYSNWIWPEDGPGDVHIVAYKIVGE